ncbi:MAG: hypothetical protein CMP67_03015 [Flavobacteriales bacterium]|nr:hypothetical protein [Flavobacteriales bacterium]MBO72595.1 hypothetical protein [Flavobacteriales bacterium]|tara:strand:+ start:1961 stop:2635 length:675 start_codon:yes stop_codon:yes gene_type:complete
MKKLLNTFLILCSVISYAQSGYHFNKKIFGYTLDQITLMTDDGDSKLYIDDLLFKMFNPDSTVSDFELAMGYYGFVLQPDYNPDKYIGLEMQVMALNNKHEWTKAKKLADSLVTNYPTCLMGHVELSYAFNSLQDTVQAALYRRIYERLSNMIFQTGDGLSMETAYIVTGYKDIEVLTQLMRMRIKKRKRKTKKKSTFEIVTVYKNFEKMDVYFDTSLITEFKK